MAALVREVGLREAGRLTGRGREQVRKFVSGEIERPHERTREAMGGLYLDRHPALDGRRRDPSGAPAEGTGRAAEREVESLTPTPLRLILPRTLEKATAEIRAMFALLRGHPDAPETTVAVEQWLLRQVKREYAGETAYPRTNRGRKSGGEGKKP